LSYRNTPHESLLVCLACHAQFPIIHGIPRLLLQQHADPTEAEARTATSFGFEWSHFSEMYPEWEQNFLDYMAPHDRSFFQGKKVLDAGCGSGRHAYYAAKYGADVCAVDASQAADIAARNTRGLNVNVVQADLNHLPFAPQSFDLVYSIGVLHHLSDPEAALRYLLRFLKPDGEIRVFLYWAPDSPSLKHTLLAVVNFLRRLTTRLPHRVVYILSYVAAATAWVGFVWPYRILRALPGCQQLAERLPMRQYSRYPFRACVNDQFDRFSAPIERRYTRVEVEELFRRVGRENVTVRQNFGWVASSRKA
jgi:SAM-dependent methyltransferase